MKPTTEYIFKIRNSKTGEFGDGRNHCWGLSFLDSTMYHSEGPAKASLTRIKLLAAQWEKNVNNRKYAKELYDFVNDAEVVRIRVDISEEK
jgi:hypothetical protein